MDDSQFFYLIRFHSFQVDTDTKWHAAERKVLRYPQETSHKDDPSLVVASSKSTIPQGQNLVAMQESIKTQGHCNGWSSL